MRELATGNLSSVVHSRHILRVGLALVELREGACERRGVREIVAVLESAK